MDSSSLKKGVKCPTPRGTKTPGQQTEVGSAGIKVSQNRFPSKLKEILSKPGLPLEKKIELLEKRKYALINEHNKLTCVVKEKEAELNGLQKTLENIQQPNSSQHANSDDALKQHICELDNNLDKMRIKIREAKKIQTTYQHIREHLQQEVRGEFKLLEKKELAVVTGQAEVDKASKQLQSATDAVHRATGKMLQMECEAMEKKRELNNELCELSTEEKELKSKMEAIIHLALSPTGQSGLIEVEAEEDTQPTSDNDHQDFGVRDVTQSNMKLVEDMEVLREAMGCADVQDLVDKAVSWKASNEQLFTEITQDEEVIKLETRTVANLECHYAKLKFGGTAATTRFDELKRQMQAKLTHEKERVTVLQDELKQSQDLLDTAELGFNNIYFRMSCVPVEGFSCASSTDSEAKQRHIRACLSTLQQRLLEKEPEIISMDEEMIYSQLEQLNLRDPRNNKRPETPTEDDYSSDDEECVQSREEIKRSSRRLIESQKNEKSRARMRQQK